MKKKIVMAALCTAMCGGAYAGEITSELVGTIRYDETPGWTIASRVERLADGREKILVSFSSETPHMPPRTAFTLRFPLRDAVGRWHTGAGLGKNLRPVWGCGLTGSLADQAPIVSVFSDSNRNRGLVACSKALRRVHTGLNARRSSAKLLNVDDLTRLAAGLNGLIDALMIGSLAAEAHDQRRADVCTQAEVNENLRHTLEVRR